MGSVSTCTRGRLYGCDCRNCKPFFTLLSITSLCLPQNIDRRPPTLLNKFTLQQFPPSTLPSVPKYLYFLPNSTKSSITVVTAPPLTSYELSPVAFFDAQEDGLRVRAHGSEISPEEYSEIVRFVRTPEGRGVGVIRKSGGQIWTLAEGDKELNRSGSGDLGDKIVVLDKGQFYLMHRTGLYLLFSCEGRTFATYNTSDTTLNYIPILLVHSPYLQLALSLLYHRNPTPSLSSVSLTIFRFVISNSEMRLLRPSSCILMAPFLYLPLLP